jgi:hypothetical protein
MLFAVKLAELPRALYLAGKRRKEIRCVINIVVKFIINKKLIKNESE